jgi:hypothetical protein
MIKHPGKAPFHRGIVVPIYFEDTTSLARTRTSISDLVGRWYVLAWLLSGPFPQPWEISERPLLNCCKESRFCTWLSLSLWRMKRSYSIKWFLKHYLWGSMASCPVGRCFKIFHNAFSTVTVVTVVTLLALFPSSWVSRPCLLDSAPGEWPQRIKASANRHSYCHRRQWQHPRWRLE